MPVAGGGYRYPGWVTSDNADINDNLLWTSNAFVAGFGWGISNEDVGVWRQHGFDRRSLVADPLLDANFALPANSPYLGLYSR